MTKRAVVLVHGWNRTKRNETRDRLVRSLEINDPMPVKAAADGAIEGETFKRLEPIEGQSADRPTVDVFEAYWGDMLPLDSDTSAVSRFLRATGLVFYWLINPWWLRALAANRSLTLGLITSGLMILVWYFVVVVALASFVIQPPASGPVPKTETAASDASRSAKAENGKPQAPAQDEKATVPPQPGSKASPTITSNGDPEAFLGPLLSYLKPVLAPFAAFAGQKWFVLLVAFLSFLPVAALANLAAFVRLYLNTGANNGYDAEVIQRVQDTLDRVYARRRQDAPDEPEYDEVYLVGHSMGGVIALEALAEYGRSEVAERTTLVTWGSALQVLAARSPERVGPRIALACSGRVPRWFDFHSPNDWLSAPIAAQKKAYPNATFTPKFSVAWWQSMGAAHDQYYFNSDVLRPLLAPASATPASA